MHAKTAPLSTALKPLNPTMVRLQRLVGDVRLQARLRDLGLDAQPAAREHELHEPRALRLQGDGGAIEVEFSSGELPTLGSLATLAEQARRDAAATLLLQDAFDAFARLGLPVDTATLPSGGHAAAQGVGLVLQGMHFNLRVADRDTALLDRAEQLVQQWPLPLDGANTRVVRSVIRLGAQALPAAALKRLRRGDVLVGGLAAFGAAAPYTAELLLGADGAPHARAACTLHDNQLTMSHDIDLHHSPGAGELDDPPQGGIGPVSVERLAFNVQYEIDGPAVALGELAQLNRGRVLEMGVPVDQARIRIRVNGHTWAYGELVAIGGQLGVRITSEGGDDVRSR